MVFAVLLISMAFASELKENDGNLGEKTAGNLILIKIEDDEYAKVKKRDTSIYIGVSLHERKEKWEVTRWSKNEKKNVHYGKYDDEETAAQASDTLARKLLANGEQNHNLNFPDDETEVHPKEQDTSSKHIGVSYNKIRSKWRAARWSKMRNKMVYNGHYKDEETAARASDTLARKLIQNGEQNHKLNLNFPDDNTEVHAEEQKISSEYLGVSCDDRRKKWSVSRWSKDEKKAVHNGTYNDEETAAHASDTLARKLMANGEPDHELNFPDNKIEVHPQEERSSSIYVGVTYHKRDKNWSVSRWSRIENKNVFNGYYKDEETAAHVSDTLARELMANGGNELKLNFPSDHTEVKTEEYMLYRKKRKRADHEDLEYQNK